MKRVTFIIPHYRTWKWTAICLHRLRMYGIPVEQEIIVVNNSPAHPSIRSISETPLGKGVTIIDGNPEFTSHGMGYDIGASFATGDWIFTCETDSFPTRSGWFDEYLKLSVDHDLIGPEIPQGSGRYIHPAGALVSRRVLDCAAEWREDKQRWMFCPGAAPEFGLSDRGYHVVASADWLGEQQMSDGLYRQIELWSETGAWQEMRAFEDDTFENYMNRTGIAHFEPQAGRDHYLKIGYEAGQWLAYFAESHGFKCHRADTVLEWMPGHEGRQAARSTVLSGFQHVWCGTVSVVSGKNLFPDVTEFKLATMNKHFAELPQQLRERILQLESESQ